MLKHCYVARFRFKLVSHPRCIGVSHHISSHFPCCSIAARNSLPGARVCQMCKAALNGRTPKAQLMEHVDSKHAKAGFDACFPGYTE